MKKYEILIDGKASNSYVRGRINGMIFVLTGMPEVSFGYAKSKDGVEWVMCYVATEEQHKAVVECLEKHYPKAFVGWKEVE